MRIWERPQLACGHARRGMFGSSVSCLALGAVTALAINVTVGVTASMAQTALDDIVVEGQQPPPPSTDTSAVTDTVSDEPTEGSTTDRGTYGVDGYTAKGTSTATKTATPLVDIPQTVNVYTEDFFQDTGSYSLGQVLEYTPGVTVQQGEGHRDQITIRGQETTADFFTDGIRDDIQRYRDLYNVEAVEVLKGSTAMVFGRGGGGGVVNRVTKQADGKTYYSGSATFGSYNHKYFTADVGQAITPDFAFRLNAMYDNSDSFRDFYEQERFGINPTIAFQLTPKTTFRASYEFAYDDRIVDRGVTNLNGSPLEGFQKTFFGNPDASDTLYKGHFATASIEHEFDSGVAVRSVFQYQDHDKFYRNIMAGSAVVNNQFAIGGRDSTSGLGSTDDDAGGYSNDTQRESFFSQTDVSYSFDMGSQVRHSLVAGMEFSSQDQRNVRLRPLYDSTIPGVNAAGTGLVVSLDNPTNFEPVTFGNRSRNRFSDVKVQSFYIQDQIEITKYFEIIGGVRHDTFDIDFEEADDGVQRNRTDREWSPRVGAIVKPIPGVSVYASWSRSFLPTAGDQFDNLSGTGEDLEPQMFENSEVGFKVEVTPRLLFTGALFNLDRTNQPLTVDNVVVAGGETVTRGGELGLTGYITDEWQINAGYSNQDSEIQFGSNEGNSVEGVPRHIFSMWNQYQFTDKFAAGFGVIHQSEHFATSSNTVELPEYTRIDASMSYDLTDNLSAKLHVENVFDTDYFASAHNNFNISPGAPRVGYFTVYGKF